MASQGKAERNWSLIVPGVLLIFFGALCAFYPGITLLSVTFVAGAGFIFAGIVNIISYVRERKTAGLSGWYVAYGILDIIIGLMLVIHPLATAYVIPWLIGAFSREPEVIAFGVQQAHTAALFYCLLAFSHCCAGILRGLGRPVVPMMVMLAVWCVLRIVYITTVMHIVHEIQYIYWAYPLTWSVSSVIYFIYYHRSDWIHGFEAKEH